MIDSEIQIQEIKVKAIKILTFVIKDYFVDMATKHEELANA